VLRNEALLANYLLHAGQQAMRHITWFSHGGNGFDVRRRQPVGNANAYVLTFLGSSQTLDHSISGSKVGLVTDDIILCLTILKVRLSFLTILPDSPLQVEEHRLKIGHCLIIAL
jgi:hypothetical protein